MYDECIYISINRLPCIFWRLCREIYERYVGIWMWSMLKWVKWMKIAFDYMLTSISVVTHGIRYRYILHAMRCEWARNEAEKYIYIHREKYFSYKFYIFMYIYVHILNCLVPNFMMRIFIISDVHEIECIHFIAVSTF